VEDEGDKERDNEENMVTLVLSKRRRGGKKRSNKLNVMKTQRN